MILDLAFYSTQITLIWLIYTDFINDYLLYLCHQRSISHNSSLIIYNSSLLPRFLFYHFQAFQIIFLCFAQGFCLILFVFGCGFVYRLVVADVSCSL